MTRQQFKAIAEIIKRVRNEAPGTEGPDQIALDLSKEFQSFNRNFNSARFLKACGVEITAQVELK